MVKVKQPVMGADEVLVEVVYAGVNPADYLTATGFFNIIKKPTLPHTLGFELCGKVVAKGAHIKRFEVGDIVIGSSDACFASYVTVKEYEIAKLPEYYSLEEGAAIPVAALTAYQALERLAVPGLAVNTHSQRGTAGASSESLFIAGGTGAVGFMTIILGRAMGLTIYVSGSSKKAEEALALGATKVFDYKSKDPIELPKPASYGIDMVGGAMTRKVQQLVKDHGRVVTIKGIPTGNFAKEEGLAFWQQQLLQLASAPYRYYAKWRKQSYDFISVKSKGLQLEYMLQILRDAEYKPSIDSIFPLSEGAKALHHVHEGSLKGKVLLKIGNV